MEQGMSLNHDQTAHVMPQRFFDKFYGKGKGKGNSEGGKIVHIHVKLIWPDPQ